jgi:putative peptidoglycan lipid II flippase
VSHPGHAQAENRGALLKGTAILLASRLVAMALGVLQTLLIARYYGASVATDAFFVASAVPVIFLGVVEMSLGLTFTPLFIELEEKGDRASAWTLAATLFKRGGILVVIYMLLTMALARPLAHVLAPGFAPQARWELTRLILCMAPQALAVFVSSVLATMCFIRGAFLLPAVTSVFTAALPTLCMVFLHDRIHIYALPLGVVSGTTLSALLLFTRFGPAHPMFRTASDTSHPAVRQFGRLMLLRTATTSLMQLNTSVDQVFASWVGTGHIAHLAYAQQVVIAARRLFIVPVGRSAMPAMSRAVARGNHQEARSLVEQITAFLGFAIIPIFILLIGFRHEFVRLVFLRGVFTEEAVRYTAIALMFYSLGAFSAVLNPVLTALLFALRDSMSPLKVVSIGVVLNALFNYIGIRLFSFGGIALSTSAVAAVSSCMLWMCLRGRAGELNARRTLGSLGRTGLAALVMLAAAKGVDLGLLADRGLGIPLRLFLSCAAGGVVYLAAQAALNPEVFSRAVSAVRRRAQRKHRQPPGAEDNPEIA